MLVQDDPSYVALLNAPLPSTAVPGFQPTAVATTPAVIAAPPVVVTQVGGTTQAPPNAKFIKAPGKNGSPSKLFVNATPHVVGKR